MDQQQAIYPQVSKRCEVAHRSHGVRLPRWDCFDEPEWPIENALPVCPLHIMVAPYCLNPSVSAE